jgi:hypothetical protein
MTEHLATLIASHVFAFVLGLAIGFDIAGRLAARRERDEK